MFFKLGLQRVWHKSGEVIYSEGDITNSLHLVVSGRVRLSRKNGRSRKLAGLCGIREHDDNPLFINPAESQIAVDVSQGESFGEPNLIASASKDVFSDSNRLFTARAIRDSLLVRVSIACLRRLLKRYSQSMVQLSYSVSERFQQLLSTAEDHSSFSTGGKIKTITLFPSGPGTTALHVHSAAERINEALTQNCGTVLNLNSSNVDQMVGYSITKNLHLSAEVAKLSSWLSEQEELFDFIIFETDCLVGEEEFDEDDQMLTDWDSFCVRQTDCLLYIGFAYSKNKSMLTKLEKDLRAAYPSLECLRYLILLHPSLVRRPKGTTDWLQNRRVHCVQHIRVDLTSDWERIARLVSGRSVGVIFGGGGARGLAHLGVLKALEEYSIPVDMVGGTSQGAFMAGLYASRLSVRDVELGARDYSLSFHLISYLRSLTVPILSYFEGTRFSETIQNAFGMETDLCDFWIPFFCTSTSVSYSNLRVHRTGLAWKFIRASMTIVGLLPPIVDGDNDLLVDGGYCNNLPIDVMHSMPHRPAILISVDVENRDSSMFSNLYDYGPGISGFQVLRSIFDPWFTKRVPAFSDIILFLNCISHMRQLRTVRENLVSVYINPPVTHYGILDYPKMDEIVEKGYHAGKKAVAQWLEKNGGEKDLFSKPQRNSRQRIVTEMANARSRVSLHLRTQKSTPSLNRVFSEL
eukprot:TRINITY_DN9487_c0_g1_i2.p1 TRINITY_DN9487_c0_g1~~TRINITY_DN9487_c0_g1_i2.p1  ORF type:complete len:691 (-),score=136.24 TRINITY_DN9487_c0_g1_i2:60-2132(-)